MSRTVYIHHICHAYRRNACLTRNDTLETQRATADREERALPQERETETHVAFRPRCQMNVGNQRPPPRQLSGPGPMGQLPTTSPLELAAAAASSGYAQKFGGNDGGGVMGGYPVSVPNRWPQGMGLPPANLGMPQDRVRRFQLSGSRSAELQSDGLESGSRGLCSP